MKKLSVFLVLLALVLPSLTAGAQDSVTLTVLVGARRIVAAGSGRQAI